MAEPWLLRHAERANGRRPARTRGAPTSRSRRRARAARAQRDRIAVRSFSLVRCSPLSRARDRGARRARRPRAAARRPHGVGLRASTRAEDARDPRAAPAGTRGPTARQKEKALTGVGARCDRVIAGSRARTATSCSWPTATSCACWPRAESASRRRSGRGCTCPTALRACWLGARRGNHQPLGNDA